MDHAAACNLVVEIGVEMNHTMLVIACHLLKTGHSYQELGGHYYGSRLFFKGNMNPVALLGYQTREEVLAEAPRPLTIGKPGAGYILSTACPVAPRAQTWKLELLAPLADELGRSLP